MQNINTILFDLDGTLVDSIKLIDVCFRETFKTHFPELKITDEEFDSFNGPSLHYTFSHFKDTEDGINDMIKTYRDTYKRLETEYVTLFDGVIEGLEYLYNNNYNLGIITTKFKEAAQPCLDRFNIRKYFTSFIYLDDVKTPKPAPDAVYNSLPNFTNVKEVLVVGDNLSDIMCGKNANTYTCGVTYSTKVDKLKELNPTFMIDKISDLINILKGE